MAHYDYFIIGGGMTADAAVRGVREADATGSVGLISVERHPPYNRPPLMVTLVPATSKTRGVTFVYAAHDVARNGAVAKAFLDRRL